jgi:Family of unknown function (DUF6288)
MKKNCATMLCLVVTGVLLSPVKTWGQAIPDLVQSQTLGVDETKFFYLGPTGMKGWFYWSNLTRESRQILVTSVRTNTPAYGVMQYHDVILGINGGLFTNDARNAFVEAVIEAESTEGGGDLNLTVYRPSIALTNAAVATNIYTITLPVLGTLSATTPYYCPKTDATLTNFCEYVYQNGPVGSPTEEPSIWAMLASGEPKYVSWATNYVKNVSYAKRTNLNVYRDTGQKVWYTGYQLVTLCQYQLLTGDTNVIPAIADTANFIAQGQDRHGLWGHTMAWPIYNGGELHGSLPGYGALNQAGLVGLYGLVLARKCGVSDPEVDVAVDKAVDFFRAHLFIGAINYGYHAPAAGVVDSNGRMGIAAHVFRALGDVPAAKWFAMMTSTYGWRDWGHTGNEFNHCWGPMAASVGGPELAHFVHSNGRPTDSYYLPSLTMRRQPEGTFKSQASEGRGEGRSSSGISGGHATGGYAVQLAGNRHAAEITGAGYGTNFWLTAEEMEDVRFAQRYEQGIPVTMTTEELLNNLDCFSPKVQIFVATTLKARLGTESGLVTNLISIVQNASEKPQTRVTALNALGTSNVLVKATTDGWFYPSQGYVLNWGATTYAFVDQTSHTNVLAAITQFDPQVGMDMLTAAAYSQKIYNMSTNGMDAAGMALYYAAAAVILSPDCGGGWWVDTQQVRNWNPLVIARYADKIIRTAEMQGMGYDATRIMKHNQIGEGMHCAMLRATEYNASPVLDAAHMDEYGQRWGLYSNYTHMTKSYQIHLEGQGYQAAKDIIEFTCNQAAPPLKWFRDLIKTNIVNALTNPVTRLADLRANVEYDKNENIFNAVCLSEIVTHPDNPDSFVDITNHVGFIAPVIGTHWRKYRGAVELGIADTNSVDRWLAALAEASATGNDRVTGGILHVLAGKNTTNALPVAMGYLTHQNDSVAMAALDVIARLGTKNELLAVFNNFLTNSTMMATSEDGTSDFVGIKNDYWSYANWDAISGIVERDYAGCLNDVAEQLAASFNTFTTNSTWVDAVPYSSLIRTEPFAILNPVATPRKVHGFGKGVYAALGLFARDNSSCANALSEVVRLKTDPYYNRGHDFHACAALMSTYTVPEIVTLSNAGTPSPWNERGVAYYLMDQLLWEKVAVSNQLALLEVYNGLYQTATNRNYISTTYQLELNNRRGLEEKDGVFFFYSK